MLKNVPADKAILQKWLKAGYVYQGELFPTTAGTPQGGVISPTLANLTLDGLEKELREKFTGTTRNGKPNRHTAAKNQVNFVRYADDFIITGKTKELLENEVKPLVENFLKERGLTLSAKKTKVTHIEEGFDFLGWNFRKFDGKMLIKPSKKNVKAFLRKIRELVKVNRTTKQEDLIGLLNSKIRGWVNYHKGTIASETFSKVDHEIWKVLWKWVNRLHPGKGSGWLIEKYFNSTETRKWIFTAHTKNKEGKPRMVKLVKTSDTKIERHIKIRGEANPFDPAQEAYFESRLGREMEGNLKGKTKLLRLWRRQDKECPQCHERITKETGWHVHHILPKSEGGEENISNLVLLHPNCHRHIHSLKLKVVKPALVKKSFVKARTFA
jgi:RNA-directed DNA polymerase